RTDRTRTLCQRGSRHPPRGHQEWFQGCGPVEERSQPERVATARRLPEVAGGRGAAELNSRSALPMQSAFPTRGTSALCVGLSLRFQPEEIQGMSDPSNCRWFPARLGILVVGLTITGLLPSEAVLGQIPKESAVLKGHKGDVWAVAFSNDGKLVVSSGI